MWGHNETCDNIRRRNMGIKRIRETEIVNYWEKDAKKNIWTFKEKR